jgi:Protein of unknown function (DUF3800)
MSGAECGIPGYRGCAAHPGYLLRDPDHLVALFEAYFDESGSHDGSPVLCVAGYLFDKEGCLELDSEWKAVLDEYSLPFFRMSDCAHRTGPFKSLSKQQCIDCETKLIHIIKRHMRYGVTTTVNEAEYDEWAPPELPFGHAYSWCCYMCLVGIGSWIKKANFQGEIAYVFEAGHRDQTQANSIMEGVLDLPELKYKAHAFMKKEVRPLQAADLLAWQAATQRKRIDEGNTKIRQDFRELASEKTYTFHGTKQMFEDYRERLKKFNTKWDAEAAASSAAQSS